MKSRIVALGADIKNRILASSPSKLFFGSDIGDLREVNNLSLFKHQVQEAIKEVKPSKIVCDLHPNYFSSRIAKTLSSETRIPLLYVQHHHAHIASVIQEHTLNNAVIGVSFDGTGYGNDGNLWGGEFLLVKGRRSERLGHLNYRKMPGGEKVVLEPWRMIAGILGDKVSTFLKQVDKDEKKLVQQMLNKNINSPLSSSAGRLFDAAAALLGICLNASYEAQGPIEMEKLSQEDIRDHYRFSSAKRGEQLVINTDGIFLGMLKDLKNKLGREIIASKFHNSMVEIIVKMASKFSQKENTKDIVLSGGVFQNKYLMKKTLHSLRKRGFSVFTNEKNPVNDLNISLGQYYVSCCTGKN